ncbi:unnamed protein product [Staurois parvus]|uniref:Uncharacterized protein n=1 Tax=Staurois parvus TaxID=386267 RepID=A0ABN9B0N6_9NEOB|nr:unnamed protein product [Staurois parvus]
MIGAPVAVPPASSRPPVPKQCAPTSSAPTCAQQITPPCLTHHVPRSTTYLAQHVPSPRVPPTLCPPVPPTCAHPPVLPTSGHPTSGSPAVLPVSWPSAVLCQSVPPVSAQQ